MKYAIVDGQKREALRSLVGTCRQCGAVLTPKCGKIRVEHWAHSPGIVDHRWEPETEWHRAWKNCFPVECQEVDHLASDGVRHVADVKTAHGRVIEFQHSPISEEERRSREEFYRPMCWVVNGQRLKLDRQRFFASLRLEGVVTVNPLTLVVPVKGCAPLQKWADSRVLVFFDFGEIEDAGDLFRGGAPALWALRPGTGVDGPQGGAKVAFVFSERVFNARRALTVEFRAYCRVFSANLADLASLLQFPNPGLLAFRIDSRREAAQQKSRNEVVSVSVLCHERETRVSARRAQGRCPVIWPRS